jgi:tRNA threonylcarbamoyladenosine biosynthesis protein TsaB
MLILSIDTCGALGTVALAALEDGRLDLLGQTVLPGKTYSAQLIPAIRALLAERPPSALDAIVVVSGPGSFTGIRIALSAAKGLAEVHGTPILAVSRLAVLAHKALARAAALDASRHEFYFGDDSAQLAESLLSGEAFERAAAPFAAHLAVCEDSAHTLAPSATRVPPPTAADAILFALPRIEARAFDDPVTLDGNYLRRSDAEIFAKPPARPQTTTP